MKAEGVHKVLSKVSTALIAFMLGATATLILSGLLMTDAASQAVAGTWQELGTEFLALGLKLILLFGLAAAGGVVTAVVSLFLPPAARRERRFSPIATTASFLPSTET